ncbi:MAG: hypothetical protein ACM336_18140 [Acidobacteriota bacterium]
MFHAGSPAAAGEDATFELLGQALGARHPELVPALRARAKAAPEQALELTEAILKHARAPESADTETTLEFYSEILRVLNS